MMQARSSPPHLCVSRSCIIRICHLRGLTNARFTPSRERIFVELVTSDRKLKASREGLK